MAEIECPDCGENIKDTAKVCPYCGRRFLTPMERATKAFEVAFVVIVVGVMLAAFSLRGR